MSRCRSLRKSNYLENFCLYKKNMAIRYLQIIIAILLFVSCESDKQNDNSINGVWQSIGYGKILKITSDQFQLYDVTQISCLPIEQGNLSNLGSHLNVNNGVLSISKGLNIYQYTKVDALPQTHPPDKKRGRSPGCRRGARRCQKARPR